MISIFRNGKRNDTSNYRGISLFNITYKIYIKIINERLRNISDSILLEERAGFWKGRSCIDDFFSLKQIIQKKREFNLVTHLALMDYKKAFDKVRRDKLWSIIDTIGFPKHLFKVSQSLVSDGKIMIDSGKELTTTILISQGVRQGCSLSPTLFYVYVDDLIREWKKLKKY